MKEDKYVLVIGAANLDITGFSNAPLIMEDSNPGSVKISFGGVGRNIAENLSKLEVKVKFLTVFGDDPYSNILKENCTLNNIDITDSLVIPNAMSPVYLSILDNEGDMKLALCDAEVLNKLDETYLKSKASLINNAAFILIDTNLTHEAIKYICTEFRHKPIFTDGVSTQKSLKLSNVLNCLDTLKLNLIEAKMLSGINITSEDYLPLIDYFVSMGVKNVFITLGSKGVLYGNGSKSILKPAPRVNVVNATGAGDAFMAAILYGSISGLTADNMLCVGIAASLLALSHEATINPNLSLIAIKNIIEELKIC